MIFIFIIKHNKCKNLLNLFFIPYFGLAFVKITVQPNLRFSWLVDSFFPHYTVNKISHVYVFGLEQPSHFVKSGDSPPPAMKVIVSSASFSFYLLMSRWWKHGQISVQTLLPVRTRFSVLYCNYLHLHTFSNQTEMRLHKRCCCCGLTHVLRHRQVRVMLIKIWTFQHWHYFIDTQLTIT